MSIFFILAVFLSIFTSFNIPIGENVFLPSYGEIIKHTHYTLSYNEKHEQANWVAYTLNKPMLYKRVKRINYFKMDTKVKTGSVNTNEYKKSGYDRGHLVPAADMLFSKLAMKETFLTSNISPQSPDLNRGIWKSLENKIRGWILINEELHIVCGGVLHNGLMEKIGTKDMVTIPKYYYKVILDIKEPQTKAIGFIFPNKKCISNLMDYAVSVDSVEILTGLDFYPSLEDKKEEILESNLDISLW